MEARESGARGFLIGAALAGAALAAACGGVTTPGGNSESASGSGGVGGAGGAGSTVSSGGAGTAGTAGMGGSGGVACVPGEMIACYSGPASTQGVGDCHGGQSTCNADGSGYGPCMGEVIPTLENCQTPADENCNAAPIDGCGEHLWSQGLAGAVVVTSRLVSADSAGNVIVSGTFHQAITLGAQILVGNGPASDIFVAKLDGAGNHLWSKRIGTSNDDYVNASAVDAAGNVIVTGIFVGSLDLGGGVVLDNPGPFYATFVVKLDGAGNVLWAKHFPSASARSVAADAAGNVIVAGDFSGAANFGGGGIQAAGGTDVFVVKLAPTGMFLWNQAFGDINDQIVADVAVDSMGNVILTGSFEGSVNFGGGVLTSAGSSDVYVTKLGSSGAFAWSKRFGDFAVQTAQAVAITPADQVVLTGTFDGALDLGGGALVSTGQDIFLGKLGAAGNHLWSKRFGDAGVQAATSVAVDAAGRVTLVARFDGTLDFGGGALANVGQTDAAVARLDAAGGHVWSRRYGSSLEDTAGVAVVSTGEAFVIGNYDHCGAIDFGGGPLCSVSPQVNGVFLTKFAP